MSSHQLVGQTSISENKYDSLKRLGLINNVESYDIQSSALNKSAGYWPNDSSFTIAIPPSDDGSSSVITLPFDFCFYGNPETEVYINNNGNISFGGLFTSSTPFDFPITGFKVIAPFWSDVDTRARGGVYYKVLPNALIVNWDNVGHFDQNNTRGNSYQLIISDGTSELLPFGYTVGCFYHKVDWTTGDASGGFNGFGGAPAIVGMNSGDGINYALAGKYSKSDTTFFASVDSLNGVVNLIDQHLFLHPCDSVNQNPGLMGHKVRDTIGVCVGDTLNETYRFLPPEFDQNVLVVVTSSVFPGFSLTQVSTGNMATASFEIIGEVSNMGFHTLHFKVIDNGSFPQILDFDMVVQIDSLPTPLFIVGDSIICSYDTTSLQVPNIYETILWNTGSVGHQVYVIPGQYEVTVSSNNCEANSSFNVIGFTPDAQIIGDAFICYPDSVVLTAPSNNDAYLWSTGDTLSQIKGTTGGDYWVNVIKMGCENVDSIFLNDSVVVKINTSNINSCNGDSVQLSVSNDYDQVLWSTGAITNSITVLAGTYSVIAEVFSMGGPSCQAFDTIVISNATIIPVTVFGDTVVCGNELSIMEVLDIYDSYEWDNGGVLKLNVFNVYGYHSVTVTDGTCIDTLGFTIQSVNVPNVRIQGNLFYCDTVDSARLIAVGDIWDSLFWSTGDIIDTIYTGFGWKMVTVWKDGCSNVAMHPVNELINGVDVKGITDICQGQSTRLDVELGFDLYQWSTGGIGFSTSVNTPGDYWCVVSLDSCFATTDTITVSQIEADTASIFGDRVMCDSAGGVLFADFNFNQFSWSTGETTPIIFYTAPGIYSVTVEDDNYCVTSDTVEIIQRPSVVVSIQGDSHYCFQDSSILSVGIYDAYLWSNGSTDSTLKARAGVYAVKVTDSLGCQGTDQNYSVTQTSPEANIYAGSSVCVGYEMLLYTQRLGNQNVLWSSGATTDSIFVIPGGISLRITDAFGCSADSLKIFKSLASPEAGIKMNPENKSEAYLPVGFNDDSPLNGAVIQTWYWSIGDSIQSSSIDTNITFYQGGELLVTHALISIEGCTDTISIIYKISDDIVRVNVITPNGDGLNDYLVFPNLQKFPNNTLSIYNRWGVQVARFEKYRNLWDAYNMPDGTYFYVLQLGTGIPAVKGSFMILR